MREPAAVTALLLAAGLAACTGSAPVAQSEPREATRVVTAAQIFQQMMWRMEEQRAVMPWNKRRFAENPYDMLEVKIEDWYATEEGRFAHSIKIPNPVPEDSGYKPGMTQQQYFEHLCRTEAGEFIFMTADNVEGIYQMRPRRVYSTGEWQHLYALEDPYGYWVGEWEDVGFTIAAPGLYTYFEIHPAGSTKYDNAMKGQRDPSFSVTPPAASTIARYSGYNGRTRKSMKLEFDTKARARYGFTWRGIKRPHDREMGIAGGELIVLDLHTNEVMGVRRGYNVWNREWTGRVCPRYGYLGGQDKSTAFTTWFIAKVARPTGWKEFIEGMERTRPRN